MSTNEQAPYQVIFRFTNASGSPLYMKHGCGLTYDVTACADDHAAKLSLGPGCSVDCSDPLGGCVLCDACMQQTPVVTGDVPLESTWAGQTCTFGKNAEGCQCHRCSSAPAARYRIAVPVYASEADSSSGNLLHEKVQDFELPTPGGVVEVALDMP